VQIAEVLLILYEADNHPAIVWQKAVEIKKLYPVEGKTNKIM
jgi:hypothetical protein